MPVVVTQVITQVQRILKNGHTCVKGPLKGGFLQVWQQKCPKTGFLLPYLQRIWATEPVVTGMAKKEANRGQQAGKWPYLRDVNTIKPAKKA